VLTDKRRVQRGVLGATLLVCAWQGAAAFRTVRAPARQAEGFPQTAPVPEAGPRPPASAAPLLGIDLNRATREELALLPGIGPVASARIMADRQRRGPFLQADALQRVHGIGPKTVAAIRPYLLPLEPPSPLRLARQRANAPETTFTPPPASQSEVVSPGGGIRQYDEKRK